MSPEAIAPLEAMEGNDQSLALELVTSASTEAVNVRDDRGGTLLLAAATSGHTEACRMLLARDDFDGINAQAISGTCALHLAAANSHLDICSQLLSCPRFELGVNAPTDRGQTPLDFCREFGN